MYQHLGHIQSPICTVIWAGWKSDTYRLSQSGWKIAHEFDQYRLEHRFIFDNETLSLQANARMEVHDSIPPDGFTPVIHVGCVASKIMTIHTMDSDYGARPFYREIDTTPRYLEEPLYDPAELFAYKDQKVPEIFYEKADMSVVEHLQAIKGLQADKQAELRKRVLDVTTRTSQEPILKLIIVN